MKRTKKPQGREADPGLIHFTANSGPKDRKEVDPVLGTG
jgi:hypothetical protein